jgi:flagellar basal body-associated protein FliL
MENPKKSPLPKIFQIVALVFMAIFSLTGLAAAYIVFAPDNLPKPFYLQYNYPTAPAITPGIAKTKEVSTTVTPTIAHVYVPGEGIMIDTGTKIINLSDPTGRQYIRITIVIEFAPTDPTYLTMTAAEKSAYVTSFTAEVTAKLPVIEDAIITQISTKTFDQLYTVQGKEELRSELSSLIMQRMPEYHVLSVYFTEFVVE